MKNSSALNIINRMLLSHDNIIKLRKNKYGGIAGATWAAITSCLFNMYSDGIDGYHITCIQYDIVCINDSPICTISYQTICNDDTVTSWHVLSSNIILY